MRVLPSTIVIASIGAASAASATTLLAVYGFRLGDWWPWCVVAVMGGIAVLMGGVVRELILRAPPERYRKIISDAALGGMDVGLGVGSGHHGGGDSGGGDGGGGDGGGGH